MKKLLYCLLALLISLSLVFAFSGCKGKENDNSSNLGGEQIVGGEENPGNGNTEVETPEIGGSASQGATTPSDGTGSGNTTVSPDTPTDNTQSGAGNNTPPAGPSSGNDGAQGNQGGEQGSQGGNEDNGNNGSGSAGGDEIIPTNPSDGYSGTYPL